MNDHILTLDPHLILSLGAIHLPDDAETMEISDNAFHDIIDTIPTLGLLNNRDHLHNTLGWNVIQEHFTQWLYRTRKCVASRVDGSFSEGAAYQFWYENMNCAGDTFLFEVVTIGSYVCHANEYDYDFTEHIAGLLAQQVWDKDLLYPQEAK